MFESIRDIIVQFCASSQEQTMTEDFFTLLTILKYVMHDLFQVTRYSCENLEWKTSFVSDSPILFSRST